MWDVVAECCLAGPGLALAWAAGRHQKSQAAGMWDQLLLAGSVRPAGPGGLPPASAPLRGSLHFVQGC